MFTAPNFVVHIYVLFFDVALPHWLTGLKTPSYLLFFDVQNKMHKTEKKKNETRNIHCEGIAFWSERSLNFSYLFLSMASGSKNTWKKKKYLDPPPPPHTHNSKGVQVLDDSTRKQNISLKTYVYVCIYLYGCRHELLSGCLAKPVPWLFSVEACMQLSRFFSA